VADLRSSPEALDEVLHAAVRVIERPNAINPRGTVRDRDAVIAGFLARKRLPATQTVEVLELLVSGDRVAVRATWRGTIGEGTHAFAADTELVAHVAAWLTVADGRIQNHETFDCYKPLPSAGGGSP
jgi:ketosteroid isomerase-like protein